MITVTIEDKKYYLITDQDLHLSEPLEMLRMIRNSSLAFFDLYLIYEKISRMKNNGVTGFFFATIRTPSELPRRLTENFKLTPLTGAIKGYYGELKDNNKSTISPIFMQLILESRKQGLPITFDTQPNQKTNKQVP